MLQDCGWPFPTAAFYQEDKLEQLRSNKLHQLHSRNYFCFMYVASPSTLLLLLFFCIFLKTHDLALQPRLSQNSVRSSGWLQSWHSSCLSLPSARMSGSNLLYVRMLKDIDFFSYKEIKPTCHSCRGLGFSSYHPHVSLTTVCNSSSGDPMPSSGFQGHCMHMVHRH